jgi:hypothetical protein
MVRGPDDKCYKDELTDVVNKPYRPGSSSRLGLSLKDKIIALWGPVYYVEVVAEWGRRQKEVITLADGWLPVL